MLFRRALAVVATALTFAALGCTSDEPTTPTPPADDSDLPAPPSGQGFQMQTADIQVNSGVEEQDCYFFKVSDLAKSNGLDPTQPVNLHRIEIAQRKGSHHMNVFKVKTIVNLDPAKGAVQTATNGTGECFKSGNWADWPLVANSQLAGAVDWTYPDGVANTFQPDDVLMLQTHWVNASTQQTPTDYGKVRINFWTMPTADVKYKIGTIFATDQSIRICQSNPAPKFEASCQINAAEPVHIIGANGHFHSRGKTFDIYSWDGKSTSPNPNNKFYESDEWSEPPMLHSPDLDLVVQPGGGIYYSCEYEWVPPDASIGCAGLNAYDTSKWSTPAASLDCCYTFGPIVEKNEHCNAFVYYYHPASEGDLNITCQ